MLDKSAVASTRSAPWVAPLLVAATGLTATGLALQHIQADVGGSSALLWAAGAAGFTLSLSTALTCWLLRVGRVRSERLAGRMNLELERLATVARRTSNAVIMTDADLRITWVNEGFTRIYGYTAAEAIGERPGDLLGSGQTPASVIDAIKRGAREGVSVSEQVLNRTRDGALRWVRVDIQPLRDAQGQLQGFVEIGTDLTAATIAANELASERERLAGIIDGTHVGTWEWDLATDEIRRDERAAEVIGSSLDDPPFYTIVDWRDNCHPADRERMASSMQEHLKGLTHSYSCDYRIRHKQGQWVWVQARARVTRRAADGSPLWVAGILMDIGERKAAEQALQDSEAMLERTGRISGVTGWQFDVRDGSVRWTAQAHRVLDTAPAKALTLKDAFNFCASEARPRLQQALRTALDSGQGWDMELPFVSPKRGATWMRSLGEAEREDGKTVRVFGTLQDITERKALELRTAEGESFVREITDQLPMRVAYFDAGGCYRFVNQAVCNRFGLPREQIIGRTLTELTRAPLDPAILPQILRVRSGQIAQWEGPETIQGREIVASTTLIPAFDRAGAVCGAYSSVLDITELRRTERDMRHAYELVQSILENLPCAISVLDSELNLVLHNSQFRSLLDFPEHLFGGPRTSFESIVRFNAERGEYGDGDIEATVAHAVERVRQSSHQQYERVRPDGSVLEVRSAPLPGGGIVTTCVDASERKRMALEQQRAAATLRAVLDALPCGLTMHGADGTIAIHNRQWLDLYGHDSAFVAETGLRLEPMVRRLTRRGDYGDISEEAAIKAAWARIENACRAPHSWLRPAQDGRLLEIRSAPAPGGGFVSTYTDVTVQKQAESDREKSRAILLGAIEAVDEAFVLFDPDDRLVLCNDKYRALYGDTADLVVPGVSFEHLARETALRGQFKAAIGRIDDWVAERVAVHRSGATLVQHHDNGTWLRVIERKMADGHIVGFRIDITDLMNARQAAEQASQSKSQFLANMSHEIRTPMNAILGMLSLLQRTEQTPRQREYTRKTEGAARSLLSLLNDILDFSKAEAGKMALDVEP